MKTTRKSTEQPKKTLTELRKAPAWCAEDDPAAVYLAVSMFLMRQGAISSADTQLYYDGFEYQSSFEDNPEGIRIIRAKGGTEQILHQVRVSQLVAQISETLTKQEAIQRDLEEGRRGYEQTQQILAEPNLSEERKKLYQEACLGAEVQFSQRQDELQDVTAKLKSLQAEQTSLVDCAPCRIQDSGFVAFSLFSGEPSKC
jgi:hypothetical protein